MHSLQKQAMHSILTVGIINGVMDMKHIFVLLFLLAIVVPSVLAGTMTRQATKTTVAPGGAFSIVYNSPSKTPSGWSVDEGIPDGFNSTPAKYCQTDWGTETYTLKCRTRFGGGGMPYTLNLIAPSKPGTYKFDDGQYILWTDQTDTHTDWTDFPALTIVVGNSACAENWGCTNWGACASDNKQSRTCTDSNNCGTETNKPVLTQDCGSSDGTCDANSSDLICKIMAQFGVDRTVGTIILVVGGIFGVMILFMLLNMMMGMMKPQR
jgi:hypothetical protein